jgi:hypothetical protein
MANHTCLSCKNYKPTETKVVGRKLECDGMFSVPVYKEIPAHCDKHPRYFKKCVGYKGCFPIVETILFLDKVNDGHIQLIYNPGNTSHAIPSLDFVNDVMGGKIKEIPVSQYDMLYNKLSKYSSEFAEMAEEIYSK